MAIDGVKIIDSDDAYDIYNDIVERYKDGIDVDIIKKDWLNEESNFCTDELYVEIYWTSFAYALWKIGSPDEDIKNKALNIISKGASELWNEIDEKAMKKRQKVLDKLADQLQSENQRPVKKYKPVKVRKPYFELGDVISIRFENEYGMCFVSDLDVRPRKIEYHLACTRNLQKSEPTMDDLGELLPHLKKIGSVKLKPYVLGVLAPAGTLEDFFDDITNDSSIWCFRIMDTKELIEDDMLSGHE